MKPGGSHPLETAALEALRNDDSGGPTVATKARLSARLAASIAAGTASSLEPQQEMDPPSATADGLAASGAPTNLLVDGVRVAASEISRTLGVTLTAFAVGGAVGAGVYAAVSYPEPRIVYVDRVPTARAMPVASVPRAPTETIAPHVPAEDEPSPDSSAEPVRRQRRAPAARLESERSNRTPAEEAASLAEQQALLDKARAGLARGQNEAVLDALLQHSHRYPDSALAEERDVLAIKALVAAGRHREAQARGARFQEQFPNSLLWPSVRDALERLP